MESYSQTLYDTSSVNRWRWDSAVISIAFPHNDRKLMTIAMKFYLDCITVDLGCNEIKRSVLKFRYNQGLVTICHFTRCVYLFHLIICLQWHDILVGRYSPYGLAQWDLINNGRPLGQYGSGMSGQHRTPPSHARLHKHTHTQSSIPFVAHRCQGRQYYNRRVDLV